MRPGAGAVNLTPGFGVRFSHSLVGPKEVGMSPAHRVYRRLWVASYGAIRGQAQRSHARARLKPTPGLRSGLPYQDPTPGLRGGIFALEQMLRHPPHGGPGNLVWGRSGKELPCDCVPLPDGIGRGRLPPLRATRKRGAIPILIGTVIREPKPCTALS